MGFSSVKDVDLIQVNLKSVSIFSNYWLFFGKNIQCLPWSAILSPNMRDFANQGLWPFPDDIFNFFVGELLENNWGKLAGFLSVDRMLTWFSLIWSQFQFLVTIDYFLGKKHIESMLYASTQPEGELLSNRYGTQTTHYMCTIRRVLNYPISSTLYKSQLSFAVLVRWPIRSL